MAPGGGLAGIDPQEAGQRGVTVSGNQHHREEKER